MCVYLLLRACVRVCANGCMCVRVRTLAGSSAPLLKAMLSNAAASSANGAAEGSGDSSAVSSGGVVLVAVPNASLQAATVPLLKMLL